MSKSKPLTCLNHSTHANTKTIEHYSSMYDITHIYNMYICAFQKTGN